MTQPKTRKNITFKQALLDLDKQRYELPLILGKSSKNKIIFKDLVKLKHVLISGVSGSGKSVFIDAVISTFLNVKSPKELQLLLIDPKIAEVYIYDDVPDLLRPVALYDVDVVFDMIEDFLEEKNFSDKPRIVIIVDEFSDLISKNEKFEDLVTRITQKKNNSHIHLLLTTSKPSSGVITKKINECIPARISFRLDSEKDSQIALGKNGAEKLSGIGGEMLYKNLKTKEELSLTALRMSEIVT